MPGADMVPIPTFVTKPTVTTATMASATRGAQLLGVLLHEDTLSFDFFKRVNDDSARRGPFGDGAVLQRYAFALACAASVAFVPRLRRGRLFSSSSMAS